MYDVIIIGGGPTGLNCAISAKKAKLDYIVLEKGVLVNSIYHFPINMTFFSTSKLLEIGNVPFISHNDKPTRKEALEYYRRIVEQYELNIRYYEAVQNMQLIENSYEIITPKGKYQSRSVIVATGFYDTPRLMNIPGEELSKVKHYYDDAHPYTGQKILVIGAANSACDVALETYYKGAEVTMAIRGNSIYKGVKYWIRPNIENRIKEGSIKAYFNTTVEEIRPQKVLLNTPRGNLTLENDFVLAMTGYQPNFDLIQRLGIDICQNEYKEPLLHPDTFETNLPNVYMAGVVCAGLQTNKLFIENTREHGEQIVEEILRKKRKSQFNLPIV